MLRRHDSGEESADYVVEKGEVDLLWEGNEGCHHESKSLFGYTLWQTECFARQTDEWKSWIQNSWEASSQWLQEKLLKQCSSICR